jgi:hypothetical protein
MFNLFCSTAVTLKRGEVWTSSEDEENTIMARPKKVSDVFIGKVRETYRVFSFRRLNVVLKSLLSLGFYIFIPNYSNSPYQY